MRQSIFRGKRVDNGEWVFGDLIHGQGSRKEVAYIVPINQNDAERRLNGWGVSPESVGEATGFTIAKQRALCEHDIVFEEIECEQGDKRIYFICLWVKEWGCFCLFSLDEYRNYITDETLPVDETVSNTFIMSQRDCSMLHYAGNICENKELLNLSNATQYDWENIGIKLSGESIKYANCKTTMSPKPPVATLTNSAIDTTLNVYKPLNKFQQWCIRKCFGFVYTPIL